MGKNNFKYLKFYVFCFYTLYILIWEENQNQKNIKMKCENYGKIDITTETKNESKELEWKIIDGVKKWVRNCPECNKEVYHSTKGQKNKSKNKNHVGICCKNEKIKNSIKSWWNKRKNETKNIIWKSNCKNCNSEMLYNTYLGFIKSNPKKCRKCFKKLKQPLYRECTCGKILSYNNKYSYIDAIKEKTKCKSCIFKEKNLKKWAAIYNPFACKIFDEINDSLGWSIQHALNGGEVRVIGYSLDGYDKEKNIVIEYDEKYHDKQIEKDIIRQKQIEEHLGCKFYRIPYNQCWKNIINE
jgi:hypothetical protein